MSTHAVVVRDQMEVSYMCPECGNFDSAPEGYWSSPPPCSWGPPCTGRMEVSARLPLTLALNAEWEEAPGEEGP